MQLLTDLKNGVNIGQASAPASKSATFNSTSVDLNNSDVRTHSIISNGVVTGSAIWTVQVEESDDDSSYAAIADPGGLSAQITAAGITLLSYQRTKRYVRHAFTLVSGTSSVIGAEILSQKKEEPASAGYSRSPST